MNHPEWKNTVKHGGNAYRIKVSTPRRGDQEWGTKELSNVTRSDGASNSPASEEEIRLSVIETQCSKDTGMAQGLANLVASYQNRSFEITKQN